MKPRKQTMKKFPTVFSPALCQMVQTHARAWETYTHLQCYQAAEECLRAFKQEYPEVKGLSNFECLGLLFDQVYGAKPSGKHWTWNTFNYVFLVGRSPIAAQLFQMATDYGTPLSTLATLRVVIHRTAKELKRPHAELLAQVMSRPNFLDGIWTAEKRNEIYAFLGSSFHQKGRVGYTGAFKKAPPEVQEALRGLLVAALHFQEAVREHFESSEALITDFPKDVEFDAHTHWSVAQTKKNALRKTDRPVYVKALRDLGLDIPPGCRLADTTVTRQTAKRLLAQYHPDKNPTNRKQAEIRFKILQAAWDTVKRYEHLYSN